MSDVQIGAWTLLTPSRIERRLRQLVALVCLMSAAAIFFFLLAEAFSWALLGVALVSALSSAWALMTTRARFSRLRNAALRVDSDGAVFGRWGRHSPIPGRPLYIYTWLVLVQFDKGAAWPIWPDSLSADTYRRLLVAARWAGAGLGAAPAHHRQLT